MELSEQIYNLLSLIVPKEKLDLLIQNQCIALVTTSLINQKLTLSLSQYTQKVLDTMPSFQHNPKEAWKHFLPIFISYSIFLLPHALGGIIDNFITNYFQKQLSYIVSDKLTKNLMTNESSLKLINTKIGNNTKDSNILLKNMYEDIDTTIELGGTLVSSAFSSTIKAIHGIGFLFSVNANDMIIYSTFYNKLTSFISYLFAIKIQSYTKDIKQLDAHIFSMIEYSRINADSMIQSNNENFVHYKVHITNNKLRSIKEEQSLWKLLNSIWINLQNSIDFIFHYILIADKIVKDETLYSSRNQITWITESISKLSTWSSEKIGEILIVKQSIDRLTELHTKINSNYLDSNSDIKYFYKQRSTIGIPSYFQTQLY